MDAVEWTYQKFPGMPGDGEPGYFLGFDDDLQPYILKWCVRSRVREGAPNGFWLATSFNDEPYDTADPIVHALVENNAGKITSYAALPLRWSVLSADPDNPATREE